VETHRSIRGGTHNSVYPFPWDNHFACAHCSGRNVSITLPLSRLASALIGLDPPFVVFVSDDGGVKVVKSV
jgi:hypothetical protein